MGLADRDYMRDRYRERQGLPPRGLTWNDRKGRCEVDPSYFGGSWRTRIRKHYAKRRRLQTAAAAGVLGCLLTIGAHKSAWLNERLAGLRFWSSDTDFPASGSVVVPSSLDMLSVKSRLTLQGSRENSIVQLVDATTTRPAFSVYIRAFERVTVGAPVGQYRVRFIHGPVWTGPEKLFGRGTVQDEVLGVMPFTASIGHILDLRLGPDSGLVVRRLSSAPESLQ